ncbi:hypothetical protein LguiA_012679 [Lonicera macranthoides]
MDSISQRVYKDFEPSWDWVPEEDCDTLLLYLPGFKKEQLRVQLSRTKNLIISGERQLEDNTWSRFRKQFAISNNCDLNGISARFDAGVLYVRQPKLIMPAEKQEEEEKPTITETPKPRSMEELKEHATGPQSTSMANLAEPTNVKKNDELEAAKSVSKKGGEEEREREMEKKKGKESESSSDSESSQEQGETNAKSEDRKNLKEENDSDKIARDGMEKSGCGTGDGAVSGKTRVEKYRLGVGPVATEVKRLPKVMNMALAVLVLIVLGIYIINAIRSPMKAEK